MKTKLNLLLTAVMLLLSANVFAQSGSINPVKGDINEDGTVDVADIVAVIDIMKNGGGTATVGYFYLGTTAPTAENYKTLPGAVTTFASFDAAIGSTASVAAGQTLYLLCPAAWMKGKTPALEDKDGNTISFLEEKDEGTISDYVIYKTQVLDAPNDVVLKTETVYYWYVGHVTENNAMDNTYLTNLVNGKNSTTSTTGPSTLTMPTTTGEILIYIYPTVWGTPNIVDNTGYGTGDTSFESVGLTPPTGYGVRFWSGDSAVIGKTLKITWTK